MRNDIPAVLIGSRALQYWYPNAAITNDKSDWDIISEAPLYGHEWRDVSEWHDPDVLNNRHMAKYYYSATDFINFNGHVVHVMTLEGLAIINRSHLWRATDKFQKHITHYHRYLKQYLPKVCYDLDVRTELTHQMFPQFHPKLNQSVDDFFDDAVTKVYNHDYLHQLYAYEERPMYTKLQTDKESAWCSPDLWRLLSYNQKLQCVAEEAYVIATERFLVPKDWNYPSKLAYMKSIDKICTSLCSGYFRDFAIEEHPKLIQMFDASRVTAVKYILEKEFNYGS